MAQACEYPALTLGGMMMIGVFVPTSQLVAASATSTANVIVWFLCNESSADAFNLPSPGTVTGVLHDRTMNTRNFRLLLLAASCAARGAMGQGADTTITIRALSSTLEFVPSRIALKAGTRVRLRFQNEGTYPHNFVLPLKDDDIDDLAAAAVQAGEDGFVPQAMRSKLIAFTRMVGPNETGEVTFIVPSPGSYTYLCLFPGHAATMLGTLRSLK